ncbi:Cytosolic Fe-S cluster assembly factor nar1 [Tieghemiomyces parasiticus]|uniref:Cytosolic Fe-S cluster assembly factor nar1 n=1 Tax=Tieghemiomyces parasiticus TaxID=78921 RepID=A0A9W8AER4_9FUNG|nr:Cytosolic Fe-S cluster assembly factor nar1 [Tieghemiomyces parasiticus]
MAFSAGLNLTDLNDYIAPSQTCIKPVEIPKAKKGGQAITVDGGGDYYEVGLDGTQTKLESASISLNDCLACSGCITSAESLLITAQSHRELAQRLAANAEAHAAGRPQDAALVVVSVAPQAYAALATRHGLTVTQTARRVTAALKALGVELVFDTGFARDLSLLRIAREFVARRTRNAGPLPLLASACPGWVCYAEKTHDYALPYVSTTRSPQQVTGALVKTYLTPRPPSEVYHVCVMPCYDKKLEASREDFRLPGTEVREVDCVIATHELELFLADHGRADLRQAPEVPLDQPLSKLDPELGLARAAGTSSGGYLEYIMAHAARELFHIPLDAAAVERGEGGIQIRTVRNADFREVTLILPDGTVGLRFAAAYGFRNIQTLVRKLKLGRCSYDFVEVMACPSGCINGGGQPKPADMSAGPKAWIEACETSYRSLPIQAPVDNTALLAVAEEWLGNPDVTAPGADRYLATQYHALPKEPTAATVVGW